jgi:hypothetical protein
LARYVEFGGTHLLGPNDFVCDELHQSFSERLGAHVPASDGSLIVLLGEHDVGQADEGGTIGEDPGDIGSATELFDASARRGGRRRRVIRLGLDEEVCGTGNCPSS